MQTITQKLESVEAKLKRWQSKLTRAANMVAKLDRQRRRLAQPFKVPAAEAKLIEAKAELVQAVYDRLGEIASPPPTPPPQIETDHVSESDLPAFLDRRRPVVDKKKMPLTDREAAAFLKAQSAKVTARRAKKELRPR